MKKLTVERQVNAFRPGLGFAARMHRWFLLGAAIGVVAAIVFWHPVPLMVAAFLAVIGFAERKAGPNIVAAVSAFDSGTPTFGEADVTITCWDTDDRYQIRLREAGLPDWEYEFVPQGWQPAEGTCSVKIWRTVDSGKPVLAVADEGIMIPRYEPIPAAAKAGGPPP